MSKYNFGAKLISSFSFSDVEETEKRADGSSEGKRRARDEVPRRRRPTGHDQVGTRGCPAKEPDPREKTGRS